MVESNLKIKLTLVESECEDIRNHATQLANALMDINNIAGEDEDIKHIIKEVDTTMRDYAGLELIKR